MKLSESDGKNKNARGVEHLSVGNSIGAESHFRDSSYITAALWSSGLIPKIIPGEQAHSAFHGTLLLPSSDGE